MRNVELIMPPMTTVASSRWTSAPSSKSETAGLRDDLEMKIPTGDVRVCGSNAPQDLIRAGRQVSHERDIEHRTVAPIEMRVLLIHLVSTHIKNLDPAHAWLHCFAKPDSDFGWRLLNAATDTRLCANHERVRIGSQSGCEEAD